MKGNLLLLTIFLLLISCHQQSETPPLNPMDMNDSMCARINISGNRYINKASMDDVLSISTDIEQKKSFEGMIKIEGGVYTMGGINRTDIPNDAYGGQPREDEFPKNKVQIPSFWMDATEVTNRQFAAFALATNYVTTAERAISLDEIMAQLPEGATPPSADMLAPASLVFRQPGPHSGAGYSVQDWWEVKKGASWRHPQGMDSNIVGKEDHPVVHISWYDAMAYAKWAGKRLPTEAEWEYAAQAGNSENIFTWGSTLDENNIQANYWQGNFPVENKITDGFERLAPVKSFDPNANGLYDMAGNVWEWCSDWYHSEYYKCLAENDISIHPKGPTTSYDPYMQAASQKIIRGGSFLCNDSYCAGYRIAARMKSSPDTGLEHTGFRCVRDVI